jgi:hypothetical protein
LPRWRRFGRWRRFRLFIERRRRRIVLLVEGLVVEELHRRVGKDVGDARWFWKQRVLGPAIFDGVGERAERELFIICGARRVRSNRGRACGGWRRGWPGRMTWNA